MKPAAVESTAMASSKAVQLDSAALEFGGAWFAKQEVDVPGVERVDAHSAQVAHRVHALGGGKHRTSSEGLLERKRTTYSLNRT
eukprot:scaffold19966_cov43-Phaeocystis_antarctica.AAC.1